MMAKVGLIAGWGKLPRLWAKAASKQGNKVYAYPLAEEKTISIHEYTEQVYPVNIGAFDRLINTLLEHGIEEVVMIGKVKKDHLFNLEFDNRMKRLLAGLNNLNDDSILRAIAAEIEGAGIKLLPQTTYLEDLLPTAGILTDNKPVSEVRMDMEYGYSTALKIGELDIGQTVIVRDKMVVAVEAAEGTDLTIKRGGRLAGEGLVMAKVCKPGQDLRFDIPTLGLNTIDNLISVKAKGLIIEAGKTFLLERREFLKRAQKAGLVVAAVNSENFVESGGLAWDI
jgi:hypothetical protein